MKIEVKKQDIVPYVYFVCNMAQQTKNGMFGALGSKSDKIGGIFDRWINIIPEIISFNKYFLPKAKEQAKSNKDISVYSDFYMYNPAKVGIAPDVIGLKIANKIVPFVKYDDNQPAKQYWIPQRECPQIEVKSFFGKKYMVSLRNQHYDDKYLIMIKAELPVDYLLSFFKSADFAQDKIANLHMPDDFIISNKNELLSQTKPVEFEKDDLGQIEILVVTTARDFMNTALKLNAGDIPRYFIDAIERTILIKEEKFEIKKSLGCFCTKQESGLYRFNDEWYKLFNKAHEKTLDIAIGNPENLIIIRKNSDSIAVLTTEDVEINGYKLEKNKQYNLNFGTFGQVAGEEYFLNKDLVTYLPNKETELIAKLTNVIKANS